MRSLRLGFKKNAMSAGRGSSFFSFSCWRKLSKRSSLPADTLHFGFEMNEIEAGVFFIVFFPSMWCERLS